VDKEALFAPRLGDAEPVEIPGVGTVTVRGLSRAEAMHVQAAEDLAEKDRRVIAQGLVDPELVIPGLKHRADGKPCEKCADAGRWQQASLADELEDVTATITRLSGLAPGADKDAYRTFRGEPGDGVRVLPGEQAGDAGGPAAPRDVQ
jgi:hypothetical protein